MGGMRLCITKWTFNRISLIFFFDSGFWLPKRDILRVDSPLTFFFWPRPLQLMIRIGRRLETLTLSFLRPVIFAKPISKAFSQNKHRKNFGNFAWHSPLTWTWTFLRYFPRKSEPMAMSTVRISCENNNPLIGRHIPVGL